MSRDPQKKWWSGPIAVGFSLTIVVIFVFTIMAFHNNCRLLPSEVLECRTNWEWFWDAPPNEIGDTLAGFAGTLAFIWIVTTVWLQSNELAEQRDQLRLQTEEFKETNTALAAQRFDQAFFGLISTYSEIVNSIEIQDSRYLNGEAVPSSTKGRDCFVTFSQSLKFPPFEGPLNTESRAEIERAYEVFWGNHQAKLGHYFRFLYNAFRFISENPNFAKKHHYRLLRSQLSDQELVLLFYNCVSPFGRSFVPFACEFAIFDNLPRHLLFHPSHATFLPVEVWGNNLNEVPKK